MRVPNPFQTDPVFAKASQNLAQIIRGNPAQEAQLEASLTDARAQQQKSRFQRENREFFGNAADQFTEGNLAGGAGSLIRTGNPQVIGNLDTAVESSDLARILDEEIARGDVNARRLAVEGGGPNQAFTEDAQNFIRSANAANDRSEILTRARAAQQFPTDIEGVATNFARENGGDAAAIRQARRANQGGATIEQRGSDLASQLGNDADAIATASRAIEGGPTIDQRGSDLAGRLGNDADAIATASQAIDGGPGGSGGGAGDNGLTVGQQEDVRNLTDDVFNIFTNDTLLNRLNLPTDTFTNDDGEEVTRVDMSSVPPDFLVAAEQAISDLLVKDMQDGQVDRSKGAIAAEALDRAFQETGTEFIPGSNPAGPFDLGLLGSTPARIGVPREDQNRAENRSQRDGGGDGQNGGGGGQVSQEDQALLDQFRQADPNRFIPMRNGELLTDPNGDRVTIGEVLSTIDQSDRANTVQDVINFIQSKKSNRQEQPDAAGQSQQSSRPSRSSPSRVSGGGFQSLGADVGIPQEL